MMRSLPCPLQRVAYLYLDLHGIPHAHALLLPRAVRRRRQQLKLAGVPFRQEHIFDASKAPRSQLPYIIDGDNTVGDSETILAYVTQKYRLTIDAG
jgi:hypothetical protein